MALRRSHGPVVTDRRDTDGLLGRMAIGARQRRGAHPPHRPPIRAYVWAIAVCLIEGEALNVLVTMPGHFIAALGNYT